MKNLFCLFVDGKIVPESIRRSEDIYEINLEHPLRLLVLRCLKSDPEDRPTALDLVNELMEHKNSNDFQRSQDSLHRKQAIHRMPAGKYDYEFKIVLVGDTGVGKTSIATKFVQPDLKFQDRKPMTISIGEYNERLQLKGKSVLLQIVDTSGQFNTTSSLPQFYRGVHGAAVVFDVASWDSLVSVHQWVSMVREKCRDDIPMILVGNKTDCECREVNEETAEHVRDEFNLFYIEVSAKTGVNIDETFSVLTEQLMQQRDQQTPGASTQQRDLQMLGASSSAAVREFPSTSTRSYEAPAKFTIKEPAQRKRIEKDPDSISLKPENENRGRVVGSMNSSSTGNPGAKKNSCCS